MSVNSVQFICTCTGPQSLSSGNVEKRFRFTNENSDLKPLSRRKKGSKESKRSRGETYDDDQQYAQGETRSEKKRRKYVEDDLSPARCKF